MLILIPQVFWERVLLECLSVAIWVVFDPVPGVTASILNRQLSLPVQLLVGPIGNSKRLSDISRSSWMDLVFDSYSRSLFEGVFQLQHRCSSSSSKVERLETFELVGSLQGCKVTPCQVSHMNVVPHSCSIWRVVIITVNFQEWKMARCYLLDIGHQIVWDIVGIFSKKTRRVGTNWVEVSKSDHDRVRSCSCIIHHDLLNHSLGLTIGVSWLNLGTLIGQGIVTVNRGTA